MFTITDIHKHRLYDYTDIHKYVECAYGRLSNKWRIFHAPLNVSRIFAKKILLRLALFCIM